MAWSQRLGGGEIIIVNLFAYRTTKPKDLYAAAQTGVDIVGDRNDEAVRDATAGAMRTIAVWGVHGRLLGRGALVAGVLDQPFCLGTTRRGEPRHPLHDPQATEPTAYETNGGGDRPAYGSSTTRIHRCAPPGRSGSRQ